MEKIIKYKKNISIIFLCSGDCNNELQIINYLIKKGITISNVGFLDILYSDDNFVNDIKSKTNGLKCLFLKSFLELSESVVNCDLIISVGFQIAFYYDRTLGQLNHFKKCTEFIKIMDILGKYYGEIPWIFYDDEFHIDNYTLKNGKYFNELASNMRNKMPQII
jgi:hypothetical protein